jgi:predicted phage terminase large subunit-like protein
MPDLALLDQFRDFRVEDILDLIADPAEELSAKQQNDLKAVMYALARTSAAEYAPLVFTTDDGTPMFPEPFHREWLDACSDDTIQFLLLLGARGHAKSEYVASVDATHYIGCNPCSRTLLISSTDDMAQRFAMRAAATFRSQAFREIFPTFPKVTRETQHEIRLDNGLRDPALIAVGWGTSVTGLRAERILMEDIVTSENARSAKDRERMREWALTTLMPILVPGGLIRAVGTPYYDDDLYVTLEDIGFTVKTYPAEDAAGNIMWPSRFTREVLDRIKEKIGVRRYTTQYLCKRVSITGAVFTENMFEVVNELPPLREVWWMWDTAISEKTSADYTVGILGGLGEDGYVYVLAVSRGKWAPATAKQRIQDAWEWSRRRYGELVRGMYAEETKEGEVFKAWLAADPATQAISVDLVSHKGVDKYTRASRVLPMCEAGRIKLLRAPWVDDFLGELLSFTATRDHTHDDQVDAFVYLVTKLLDLDDESGGFFMGRAESRRDPLAALRR